MPRTLTLDLKPEQAAKEALYLPIAARRLGIATDRIAAVRILSRAVDARHRMPRVVLTLEIYEETEERAAPVHFDYPDVRHRTPVLVVGSGPGGLFAALRLVELGFRPIVLERGYEVPRRGRDIATIQRGGAVDPESNYAFGEGGAGTFSDGKLFTRSKKRGDYRKVLEVLVQHGASPEILYEARPHIGTDRLPRIVGALCETIRRAGGRVLFGCRVDGLLLREGRITGVRCGEERIEAPALVLATGHSARDVYTMLHRQGIALEAKPFAMGVRIEHPQELIDRIQYHADCRDPWLPAASYTLTAQVAGRGVYSFCMCPGGFIVPAMTDAAQSVVNGMSPSLRNSPWANAGIVTEVPVSAFAPWAEEWGPLAGMKFQEALEIEARRQGGAAQVAPAQRVSDFLVGRPSASLPASSYVPGLRSSRLDRWLPREIASALRGGIGLFGRRMHGFVTDEAVVVGVESRTSTPVRIPRQAATGMHPGVEGLFPVGEGAGYAGGIVSAALDGERSAEAVARYMGLQRG